MNKAGDISFVPPSNGTATKAIINVDTSKVNPMLNKTVNPIKMGKQSLSQLGSLMG